MLILNLLYLCAILFAFGSGCYRYRMLDRPSKILCGWIGIVFLTECLGRCAAMYRQNNMAVYSVYSLIEFFLMALYFNYVVDVFRRSGLGWYIGGAGIILGLLHLLFIQSSERLNTMFLLFEAVVIICMILVFFFRLLKSYEGLSVQGYSHFWFACLLGFFWSATLLNWCLYEYLVVYMDDEGKLINVFLVATNIFVYTLSGYVFLLMPKMGVCNVS